METKDKRLKEENDPYRFALSAETEKGVYTKTEKPRRFAEASVIRVATTYFPTN